MYMTNEGDATQRGAQELTFQRTPIKGVDGQEKKGWATFDFSTASTPQSVIRGTTTATAYVNLGIQWLLRGLDAAKENTMFRQAFDEVMVAPGNNSAFIPFRTKYLSDASWGTDGEEAAVNTPITWTDMNNINGVSIAPVDKHDGAELTNKAVRTGQLNIVKHTREELAYRWAIKTDNLITTALDDATATSDTVNGMQTIFGGDATDAGDALDDGDIITTNIILRANKLLESKAAYWWSSNVWTRSSTEKNPWVSDPTKPFLLYIAPPQKEVLLGDTQFTHFDKYGSRDTILTGEIGKYADIKTISTTVTPGLTAADTFTHQAGTVALDTNVHTCFLVKARQCGTLAWAQQPTIKMFDWPSGAKKRLALEYSNAAATTHHDGVVKVVVTDI